jgi:CubicO group peptidase (beta-lactamase class C family)
MVKPALTQFFFTTLLLLVLSGLCFSQSEKVEADIANVMKQFDVVGLSVVVVKNNDFIYSKSFGFKNMEAKTLLDEKSIFRIASISKSFSATSIMQLAEAG